MSLEKQMERIADALEKLVEVRGAPVDSHPKPVDPQNVEAEVVETKEVKKEVKKESADKAEEKKERAEVIAKLEELGADINKRHSTKTLQGQLVKMEELAAQQELEVEEVEEVEETVPVPEVEEVREAIKSHVANHGKAKALALLKKYGAGSVSEIDESKRADFIAEATAGSDDSFLG